MTALNETEPDVPPPVLRRSWRAAVFWLACFASIALLLGQLYRCGSMQRLFWLVGVPALALMAAVWWRARRACDAGLLLALRAGLVGGVLGTLGYDLVRIPLHLMGLNPLMPIRLYGVWITGAEHSTWAADLAGLLYHFSNGITFAWIYSLCGLRRHWLWAVAWALALETLAICCVFGEVFAIRTAYDVLGIAYAAHLFYGAPLGWACQRPEQALAFFQPVTRTGGWWLALAGVVALTWWFPFAWQPPAGTKQLRPREIVAGPDALYPGVLDIAAGTTLVLRNALAQTVTLELRRPGGAHQPGEIITLQPHQQRDLPVAASGIHQLLIKDHRWRSIFIAVHRAGDYRPGH